MLIGWRKRIPRKQDGCRLSRPLNRWILSALIRAITTSCNAWACRSECFLTLWKDADPDIPILKKAKAEYV